MDYKDISIINPVEQFRNEIKKHGLEPPENIESGKMYRFPGFGKKTGNTAGWCKLFPCYKKGCFGDFSTAFKKNWHYKQGYTAPNNKNIIAKTQLDKNFDSSLKAQDSSQKKAQVRAVSIWESSISISVDHPYLIRKKINAYETKMYSGNLTIGKMQCHNSIIVPIYNNNELSSLQFISPDGEKRFLPNGKLKGSYHIVGNIQESKKLYIAEGFATAATIHEATNCAVITAFSASNLKAVASFVRKNHPNKEIVLCADDDFKTTDNPGLKHAEESANLINALLVIPQFTNNRPDWAKDFNDLKKLEGIDIVKGIVNISSEKKTEPIPLPNDLPEVRKLLPEMLPDCIRDFVFDVAHRQQCAPDFVAVTALVSLSGLLGRKVRIRPKQKDDWVVTPNQWGVIIGRPSAKKSPSMKEALRPLIQFESEAASLYKILKQEYEEELQINELEKQRNKHVAKKAIEQNQIAEARLALKMSTITETPTRERFIVNDSTVEKLGELLNENPNGLILARDELFGWLSKLLKEENQAERAFYLECFDGNGYFTYDRIGRGTIEIENCILSVIGGIQPAKLATLIRSAIQGAGDDGLVQRFQLAVWPDDIGDWKWIDREPDLLAKIKYFQAFERIKQLSFLYGDESSLCLSFSTEAQKLFIGWLEEIQFKAREEEIHPALESHMLKMPQTIAGLALLFELLEGNEDSVGVVATVRALEWADYLISHAHKIYSVATNQGLAGAKLIIARKHKLPAQFSVRDVQRKEWTGFNDLTSVMSAVNWLIDYNHLQIIETASGCKGGRPATLYQWNDK